MDNSVEYLYTSDTELDNDQTNCGKIFVSFSSFDCVIFCTLCKDESKYLSLHDFVDHVKEEHVIQDHNTQLISPTDGFVAEIFQEDTITFEADDGVKYTHSDEWNKNEEQLKPSAETFDLDHDHDVKMSISEEDCINSDDNQSIDQQKIFTFQWPEDNILSFIDLYREHECLWNTKCKTYYNRSLKANAYMAIIEKYNDVNPNVLKDRKSVKYAIKQLREYFSRIDKKYQTSNLFDIKPATFPLNRFKIYEKLLFLRNVSVAGSVIKAYNCELCEKAYSTMKKINDHMKNEHADVIFTCEQCHIVCRSQFKLDLHHREHVRSDGKSYACPICHSIFKNSEDLATHLNEHLQKKLQKQICEICGANFDDRSNLLIHIRRHTSTKNYICSICNKGFVTSTELKSHIVVHSNDRPFVCEICGLRFKYSNRLNTHRLFHGEPKFKCNGCDMGFFTKRHLNEHQRMHADVPVEKIKCDICGRLFRNSDSLSRHRRKIHKIKIREQPNMRLSGEKQ